MHVIANIVPVRSRKRCEGGGCAFAAVRRSVVRANGYRRGDACADLRRLEPWRSAFWTGTALGILNYDVDVHDLVRRGRIGVHIADVARLRGQEVLLTDGTLLEGIDALVCATGWKKQCSVRFTGLGSGQPGSLGGLSDSQRQELAGEADDSILASFPMLDSRGGTTHPAKHGPDPAQPPAEPLRNHRFIVPADAALLPRRNLAYAGMLSSISTSTTASVQALWICAFFDAKLSRDPLAQDPARLTRETMLHTQFGRWRHPAGRYGAEAPDLAFDALPYADLLLNDLGLPSWRKPSWPRELMEPYDPRDYAGLVGEWARSHRRDGP
ncbi:hypothetical protein E4U21_000307 [Claviceps maximensis]|nr:hypothetical protein E4U21_000307 [Claviceps maximensis]